MREPTTLAELATQLDTDIFTLMEFAPDDITPGMSSGQFIADDTTDMIREAWNQAAYYYYSEME